ncbi:MAG: aspartate--tRNA ligase [Pseudomonadota bacterium]|nr:aspartate--tRNA ligase [Pseudomonadota bacterium]
MHAYRTHHCHEIRATHIGRTVRLSGWVHRKRDLGQLMFIDLRDHYGICQCVIEADHPAFAVLYDLRVESVVTVTGQVVRRSPATVNPRLTTGEIEVRVEDLTVQSKADQCPLQVYSDADAGEDIRLRYRYLDLRRDKMHRNIILRSQIISSLRRRMCEIGFVEFQTPILTSSSPEGARDFLVPSRLHPGKFYALPQAPQQFKQLLMMAGFDRYFQIAPCFRDEDSRADRSPGEFYQLDFEMAFATQEDVFQALEPVLHGLFTEFADWEGKGRTVGPMPFARIPYTEAMEKYGCDKPDLRNPVVMRDVSDIFTRDDVTFRAFKSVIDGGGSVRAIPAPGAAVKSRRFFDTLDGWAKEHGAPGLAYVSLAEGGARGAVAKFLSEDALDALKERCGVTTGDAVFFVAGTNIDGLAGLARMQIGKALDLIDPKAFAFCWVVDFPMFEKDPATGKIEFSHNPFSMPQGGLEALETRDPMTINAFQYDIVCNGIELSSGAVRNHLPAIMFKAFEIAGYGPDVLESRFGGMVSAMRYGAPPHAGCAPGVDRIVMLLAEEPNIREIIAFPMNQRAEDLMMQAPGEVLPEQLKDLHIKLDLAKAEKAELHEAQPMPEVAHQT